MRYPTEDERFNMWFELVNGMVGESTGLDIDDFPDWRSRDAFDDGLTPAEAFKEWQEVQYGLFPGAQSAGDYQV
jgi:hypothetical protein